jgi:DNA-binding NtrC family response regulator
MVEAKRQAIVAALRAAHGSKDGAAYFLEVSKSCLYRKIRELEIRPEEYLDYLRAA